MFYYRNRPVDDGRRTIAFPPNLRMVAGGSFPNAYWTCDGDSDAGFGERKRSIPNCGEDGKVKLHVFFPSCWDGERLDSRDHRKHVVYGLDKDGPRRRYRPGAMPGFAPGQDPAARLPRAVRRRRWAGLRAVDRRRDPARRLLEHLGAGRPRRSRHRMPGHRRRIVQARRRLSASPLRLPAITCGTQRQARTPEAARPRAEGAMSTDAIGRSDCFAAGRSPRTGGRSRPPTPQPIDAGLHRHSRLPAEFVGRLPDVADVDRLITGPPLRIGHVRGAAR